MSVQTLLKDLADSVERILGPQLIGIYLHGSLAMGCFRWAKSDIDVIAVVESDISEARKLALMEELVRINRLAPPKGLEISFVKQEFCRSFVYPTPFELHFSPAHLGWYLRDPQDYVKNMRGVDRDLAAHFTIIRRYGITLYGTAILELFAPVPKEAYGDSIWYDIENAVEEAEKDPVYVILNLCRAAAYFEEGLVLSKEGGGKWGLARLGYEPLIGQALAAYGSDQPVSIDQKAARDFAQVMRNRILLDRNTDKE